MRKIYFNTNNGGSIAIGQADYDGAVTMASIDSTGEIESRAIPAGDMVMLLNFYRYIKENDIQNDFINPNGHNKE